MFYKIRNILILMLSFVVICTITQAKAQGLVSLSEEAMFEDELDTIDDTPTLAMPKEEKKAEIPLETTKDEAPKVMPKGPLAAQAQAQTQPQPQPVVAKPVAEKPVVADTNIFSLPPSNNGGVGLFGSNSDMPVDDDLFEQMSEIEKRTALLNLELRREKLQNEIEAVKNQRRKALVDEQEKAEQARLKALEAEKKLEKELVIEQEKLRELDIKFETLRQEKILGAYKNKMLEENQKWIEDNAVFYKQIADLREAKKVLVTDMKNKMEQIKNEAENAKTTYINKLKDFDKNLEDKDAQINVLRSRIDTLEKEREKARRNPFEGLSKEQIAAGAGIDLSKVNEMMASAGTGGVDVAEPVESELNKLYAVTEIRGKGDELIARLINKGGTSFYVKKGTVLQSGHVISEITTTYIMAEKNGDKKYLYFAAGGILPTETTSFEIDKPAAE